VAITKEVVIDSIQVLELGQIQVRESTYFVENGVRIGHHSYHRHVINPGQDITNEDARVKSVANTDWTPARIAAYNAMVAARTS